MFDKDKRRLYIAYYDRIPSLKYPGPFHAALLITPKNPKASNKDSLLLHIVNKFDIRSKTNKWSYEHRTTKTPTTKLSGLLLLGKIPNSIGDEEIVRMLGEIVIQDGWRCTNWVYAAMGVSCYPAVLTQPDPYRLMI